MIDNNLLAILVDIGTTADTLRKRIDTLKETSKYTQSENYNVIIAEYAVLKNKLKEIYKYTQLVRNRFYLDSFYNKYFSPAISDCYLHCVAKTNEKNIDKLYTTLYQIWCYINCHISKTM
jgi:hypothetical protein